MKSPIFFTEEYKNIESKVIEVLNTSPEFLSARTAKSPEQLVMQYKKFWERPLVKF